MAGIASAVKSIMDIVSNGAVKSRGAARKTTSSRRGTGNQRQSMTSEGAVEQMRRVQQRHQQGPVQRQERENPYSDPDYVRGLVSRIQEQHSSSPQVQAQEAADKKPEESRQTSEQQSEEQTRQRQRSAASPDDFYADFQQYSNDNLDGIGIYDFMVTDGSDADREAWRAMTSDPVMSQYYGDMIGDDFDAWYDQMTGRTIDDVMADSALERQYFGLDDDTVNAIYQGAASDGFIPSVGEGDSAEDVYALYASDPDLAARSMAYMYVMNALMADPEIASNGLTLDEVNALADLDQMQFGYGDDYGFTETGALPSAKSMTSVNPDDYVLSINNQWSSVPGYGLPVLGLNSLVLDRYNGAGYRRRDGVDDAYAQTFEIQES